MGLGVYQSVSVAEPAERASIREHAEHAAGVNEADASAEGLRITLQRIEHPAERLRRVHRVQHDPFEARDAEDHLQLLATDLGAAGPLVAIEHADLARWIHREPVATAGTVDDIDDVVADPGRRPRDGHADDI